MKCFNQCLRGISVYWRHAGKHYGKNKYNHCFVPPWSFEKGQSKGGF